ncbi:hypothetical protein T484DRAFT_1820935 [Baffinella frigidus]|nr:hypothetical protein T484DRAFT_1820935 [Cryptophyta sp. CCMP2293]
MGWTMKDPDPPKDFESSDGATRTVAQVEGELGAARSEMRAVQVKLNLSERERERLEESDVALWGVRREAKALQAKVDAGEKEREQLRVRLAEVEEQLRGRGEEGINDDRAMRPAVAASPSPELAAARRDVGLATEAQRAVGRGLSEWLGELARLEAEASEISEEMQLLLAVAFDGKVAKDLGSSDGATQARLEEATRRVGEVEGELGEARAAMRAVQVKLNLSERERERLEEVEAALWGAQREVKALQAKVDAGEKERLAQVEKQQRGHAEEACAIGAGAGVESVPHS